MFDLLKFESEIQKVIMSISWQLSRFITTNQVLLQHCPVTHKSKTPSWWGGGWKLGGLSLKCRPLVLSLSRKGWSLPFSLPDFHNNNIVY
jgi:hypothetical protein